MITTRADQIAHVNAHATSTPEGDPAELHAIRTLFGDRAGVMEVNIGGQDWYAGAGRG